jgi:hypothetical protein
MNLAQVHLSMRPQPYQLAERLWGARLLTKDFSIAEGGS